MLDSISLRGVFLGLCSTLASAEHSNENIRGACPIHRVRRQDMEHQNHRSGGDYDFHRSRTEQRAKLSVELEYMSSDFCFIPSITLETDGPTRDHDVWGGCFVYEANLQRDVRTRSP